MNHVPYAVSQAVLTFAENMDLHAQPSSDGSYTFVFEKAGTFSLTPSSDGTRVHVSLMRFPDRNDSVTERRLLEQAGLDPLTNIFLHAGITEDGEYVCVIDIDVDKFDLPSLDYAFQRLTEALDSAA